MHDKTNRHIFIAIRYSIIQMAGKSWAASRVSPESYIERILSDNRLNTREKTFEEITFQSLADQQFDNSNLKLTVLIMVSDLLPQSRIDRIQKIINSKQTKANFIIKSIRSDINSSSVGFDYTNINEAIKHTIKSQVNPSVKTVISTVRLDDDDGLSNNFIDKLSAHMKKDMCGYAVSFAYGFEGYYDEHTNAITELKHSYFPKIAVGLAYINIVNTNLDFQEAQKIHVYNLGNHTKIDEKTPTIIESSEAMYYRSLNKTNDTGVSIHHKYLPPVNGLNSLEKLVFVKQKLITAHLLPAIENVEALEVSKSCSALLALTKLLNERIQLREKQLKEAQSIISKQ
jgi:hypothetical protein